MESARAASGKAKDLMIRHDTESDDLYSTCTIVDGSVMEPPVLPFDEQWR